MNEAELIAQARAGSETAWGQIVQQHQQPLFRLAYLILGDMQDAEDVAQESFVRAHRYLDRFDASQPLRPWLLQIARRLAYNRQRSLRRYWRAVGRLLDDPTGHSQSHTAATGDPAAPQHDQAARLWQIVQRLRRTEQEVIYLRYFLELSTTECAIAMNIAPGTVKSRLHRALRALECELAAHEPSLWEEWQQ